MSILTNPITTLLAVKALLFISLAITSLQNLANAGVYSNRGLLNWPFLRYAYQNKILESPIVEKLFSLPGFLTLNITRLLLLATALITDSQIPAIINKSQTIAITDHQTAALIKTNQATAAITHEPIQTIALTTLFAIQIALYIRSYLTMSAADQLNTILLAYLAIAAWFPQTATLCCCAIAIQTLFCYFANGRIKALEPRWTTGIHLKAILLTINYSRRSIAKKTAQTNLPTFRLLSRTVIIWELSAIAAPFLPGQLLYLYLSIGIGFHLTIALVMGLNTFFWSFLSTYPAILFLNKYIDAVFR